MDSYIKYGSIICITWSIGFIAYNIVKNTFFDDDEIYNTPPPPIPKRQKRQIPTHQPPIHSHNTHNTYYRYTDYEYYDFSEFDIDSDEDVGMNIDV